MRVATVLAVLFGTRWFASTPTTDPERAQAIDEMYQSYRLGFAGVPEISAAQLKAELDGGSRIILVDVREPKERAVSRIPGALSTEEYEALPPSSQSVVAYCTIGARSGNYASKLKSKGVDVKNLVGSILAWTHVGGELVDDDGPTRRVHVYARRWDLTAGGYESVW